MFGLTELHIPEFWAEIHEKKDHCAEEEALVAMGGTRPEPWLSFCQNPRPLRTGIITGEIIDEEIATLKREWEEQHGTTSVRDER